MGWEDRKHPTDQVEAPRRKPGRWFAPIEDLSSARSAVRIGAAAGLTLPGLYALGFAIELHGQSADRRFRVRVTPGAFDQGGNRADRRWVDQYLAQKVQ